MRKAKNAIKKIPGARAVYHFLFCRAQSKEKMPEISPATEDPERFLQANRRQKIIKAGYHKAFKELPLFVTWKLTSDCNYRCSYCFDASKGYKKEYPSAEQIHRTIDHLAEAGRPLYQLNLMGGEPTTHPLIMETIRYAVEKLGKSLNLIMITTNGSAPVSLYQEMIDTAGDVPVRFVVSVHPEFAKPEHLYELIKAFDTRALIFFPLMASPEEFQQVREMFEGLLKIREEYFFELRIDMVRTPPKFDSYDTRYTEEYIQWIREAQRRFDEKYGRTESPVERVRNAKLEKFDFSCAYEEDGNRRTEIRMDYNEFITRSELQLDGLYCCGGSIVIRIREDGKCGGLSCRMYPKKASIYKENVLLREDWIRAVPCTRPRCGCMADVPVPKFRSADDAAKYVRKMRKTQKRLRRT